MGALFCLITHITNGVLFRKIFNSTYYMFSSVEYWVVLFSFAVGSFRLVYAYMILFNHVCFV